MADRQAPIVNRPDSQSDRRREPPIEATRVSRVDQVRERYARDRYKHERGDRDSDHNDRQPRGKKRESFCGELFDFDKFCESKAQLKILPGRGGRQDMNRSRHLATQPPCFGDRRPVHYSPTLGGDAVDGLVSNARSFSSGGRCCRMLRFCTFAARVAKSPSSYQRPVRTHDIGYCRPSRSTNRSTNDSDG